MAIQDVTHVQGYFEHLYETFGGVNVLICRPMGVRQGIFHGQIMGTCEILGGHHVACVIDEKWHAWHVIDAI